MVKTKIEFDSQLGLQMNQEEQKSEEDREKTSLKEALKTLVEYAKLLESQDSESKDSK